MTFLAGPLQAPLYTTSVFQPDNARHRPAQHSQHHSVEHYEKSTPDLDVEHKARLKKALLEHQASLQGPYLDEKAYQADQAAYYGDLPQRAQTMAPKALYQALSRLVTVTHTHQLPYEPTQYLYPVVDVHPEGDLESIYSNQKADPQEAILADVRAHQALQKAASTPGSVVAQDAYRPQTGTHDYNCEHVVPQSWFDGKLPMRGDLHHLFACDPNSNSKRGNSRYADLPGDPVGEGTLDAVNNEFEPGGGKGAVARATLYFLLRYPGEVGDRDSEYHAADLKTLLDWNRQYPVTEYEKHRNEEIFKLQGNRNPLIDFPELADRVDFTQGLGAPGQQQKAA